MLPRRIILAVLSLVIASCATRPAEPSQTLSGAQTATQPGAQAAETTKPAPEVAVAPAPSPPPAPQVEPPAISSVTYAPVHPVVGEVVTVTVSASEGAIVEYDFGKGYQDEPAWTYSAFGLKQVLIQAMNDGAGTVTSVSIPVTGTAEVTVASQPIQHDVAGKATATATVSADGTYDEVRGFENKTQVYATPRSKSYELPVTFVGTRTFSVALYDRGVKVADANDVVLTGLNEPPDKPRYDGAQLLSVRANAEISFTVSSTDPNGDPVRYAVKPLPGGATFNAQTGEFSWTPKVSQAGVYVLAFRAYDLPYNATDSFSQRVLVVAK